MHSFNQLSERLLPEVQSFAYRMVAHPDDQADLVQEAMIELYENVEAASELDTFRSWFFGGVVGRVLSHLQQRRQWGRDSYQAGMAGLAQKDSDREALAEVLSEERFEFDMPQHVAFCMTCVGRSLPPHEHAVLLLRDVFGFTLDETAALVGENKSLTEGLHTAARETLGAVFEDLCALQNPDDATCSLCIELHEGVPEDGRAERLGRIGSETDGPQERLSARMKIVAEADLVAGGSRGLHDFLLRGLNRVEDLPEELTE